MTDPEFTFLNAYADTYKTALSEKESAEEEYQVASAKVTECEKAYEQAKLYPSKDNGRFSTGRRKHTSKH